ncbi:cytidine deaminase [Heliophilum fasciatum]|uniref:Cytidine deaminase n=1 Tax=Heliophilum fasciatum TaxID=35700 RepID=A0A4R2RMH8_9FIRM|nr:cytidine deaminase [Heliophilum fasciatum]MCW2278144.1 cytidine deaminase [Heliophilum fasciatum]TCP64214.1 cytidine deaminase [Heliophilum fasciatum]
MGALFTDLPVASMIQAAREARTQAYAPYSRWQVGAALLGSSGRIYPGCNVENASFGLTNCAERTALFSAVAQGERQFRLLVLTSDQAALLTPCGACRQVLAEFAPTMPVLMVNDAGEQQVMTVAELLPGAFAFTAAAGKEAETATENAAETASENAAKTATEKEAGKEV